MAWPEDRPGGYDPDQTWDEETSAWVSTIVGPGRYKQQLVVINDQGDVYFSEI